MSNTNQIKDDYPSTPIKGSSKSKPNVVSPFFKPKYKPHATQEADVNKEKATRVKYVEGIKEGSGSYAILRILSEHKEEPLTKHEILEFGQGYCKNVLEPTVKIEQGSRLQGSSTIGFGSWSSKKTLLKYELIEKCKRKREGAYKLSKDGLLLVPGMLQRIEREKTTKTTTTTTRTTTKAPERPSGPGFSKQQQTSSSPVAKMPMMKPSSESSKKQQQKIASSSSSAATVTPTKKMTPGKSSSDKSTPPPSKKRNASTITSFFSVVKKSRK